MTFSFSRQLSIFRVFNGNLNNDWKMFHQENCFLILLTPCFLLQIFMIYDFISIKNIRCCFEKHHGCGVCQSANWTLLLGLSCLSKKRLLFWVASWTFLLVFCESSSYFYFNLFFFVTSLSPNSFQPLCKKPQVSTQYAFSNHVSVFQKKPWRIFFGFCST